MNYQLIKFEIAEKTALIKLNRPEVLNSFNRAMAIELQSALDVCKENENIRAILITGEGRAFCAGQDLSEVKPAEKPELNDLGETVKVTYNPIVKKIRNIEKPVICAVNGVAAGAGANIAFACDIILASENASFIQSFSKIGLIPDSGGTFFLPRMVGIHKATALMFLAEKMTSEQAFQLGIIYKICQQEKLVEEAMSISKKLSEMPTKGLGLTKRGINKAFYNNFENHLDFEEELQREAGKTIDYSEGVNAFIEKRTPVFKGK
jgi:2-(1,2-epoxy-1,2-dihydrophenyl)acetyl-CoA isomerase